MKIPTTFKLDIRTKKTLEILSEQLNMDKTTIVENAIESFAIKNGIKPIEDFCEHMTDYKENTVYCNLKGSWINVKLCLKCRRWKP